MMHLLLLSVAAVGAAAQQQRGPGQVKLHGLAEEASFLAKHHPRVLQPVLGWHDASTNGRRRLHDLDSIPGQGACQFTAGQCIVDGRYFAKLGAVADFTTSVLDLDVCTIFDNFDGSCNTFVNPEGLCKTVALGPVLGGKACVPINSTASGMDFETGFTIRDNFGSLSAFLDEDCPEFSVLDSTAPSTCLPVWTALLRILGCDTCLRELEVVRGPVAASCGTHTTLDACISENATDSARFVLCGEDPACASVSPNTIDNPLDIFYQEDYNDYNGPSAAAPAPGSPAVNEGEDGVLEGNGEGSAGVVEGSGDYAYAPAPSDYSISGYDYGFGDAPAPDYAAAYAPSVQYNYADDSPDLRDILEGYLVSTALDDYGAGSDAYAALAITVDEPIYYGDEPFMLQPGNPWEGSPVSADAVTPVQVPEDLRNITDVTITAGGEVV